MSEEAGTVFAYLAKGGVTMIPMGLCSVATMAVALERIMFWLPLLRQEARIVHDVMDAAHHDLQKAAEIAKQHDDLPIGRFLYAPLKLRSPSPETFRLSMEAAAEREFVKMRHGDKILETVVAIGPLLGLLGTVTGLITTFGNLNIGGGGTGESATKAAAGIGEALLTTAAGMIVAILALMILRVLVTLQSRQVDYFADVGSELELVYRQNWFEPALADHPILNSSPHVAASSPATARSSQDGA